MTRADAEGLCRRLALEHPDRATHEWVPFPQGTRWTVMKVPLRAVAREARFAREEGYAAAPAGTSTKS